MEDETRMRALLYALTQPETALAALEALAGHTGPAVTEGLVELLARPHTAPLAARAVALLGRQDGPQADEALIRALASPLATVRLAAVEALGRRGLPERANPIERLLREDESWPVRRAALTTLSVIDHRRWQILVAADDPHWRVRHALIRVLLQWGDDLASRAEILERLAEATPPLADERFRRVAGLRDYLLARWGDLPPPPPVPFSLSSRPFDDPDPAVLARKLDELGDAGRRAWLDAMPSLLAHESDRARQLALSTIRRHGGPRHIAQAVALLGEPRLGANATVKALLATVEQDRIEQAARALLHDQDASAAQLAWAIDQVGVAFPADEEREVVEQLTLRAGSLPAPVCEALQRLTQRSAPSTGEASPGVPPPPPGTSFAVAAALTPERAVELVAHPERETSWHVLAQAARLARVPLWKLAPHPPWPPPAPALADDLPLTPTLANYPHQRPLGPLRLPVAPLGLSGHYGLPVEGFIRAVEAGVNALFWEPNYQTLTDFASRLAPVARRGLRFLAGSFEATPGRLRRDLDRALKALRIDRLTLFLLFWTRSWDRLTDELRRELDALETAGKVATVGLSTHSRSLAVEALAGGWGVVMVRHSAAHRGAEETIFPRAAALGTSLITFNNTCYGRLLQPLGGRPAPTAADCYRYALMQNGVSLCLTAPATLERLDENLRALREPDLPPERLQALLEQGAVLYREETRFRRLIRDR